MNGNPPVINVISSLPLLQLMTESLALPSSVDDNAYGLIDARMEQYERRTFCFSRRAAASLVASCEHHP